MDEEQSFCDKIRIEDSDYCLAYCFRLVNHLYRANFSIWALQQALCCETGQYKNIRIHDGIAVIKTDNCAISLAGYKNVLPKTRIAFNADFFRILDLMSIVYCFAKSCSDRIITIVLSALDYLELRGIDGTPANRYNARKTIATALNLLDAITISSKEFDAKLINGYCRSGDSFQVKLSDPCSRSFHADTLKMKYPMFLFQADENNCNQYAYILGHKLAETGTRAINRNRGPNNTISIRSLLAVCPALMQKAVIDDKNPKNLYKNIFVPIEGALNCLLDAGVLSMPAKYEFDGKELTASEMQPVLSRMSFSTFQDIKVRFALEGVPNPYHLSLPPQALNVPTDKNKLSQNKVGCD